MRAKILVCDRFAADALAFLRAHDQIDLVYKSDPRPQPPDLAEAHVLIARSRTAIDASLLQKAPKLQAAITATSGFDHIDFAACAAREVRIMHTPRANIYSAAELTFALLLACNRKILQAHRAVKSGDWKREPLMGLELKGKTLGIIGLGRIGSQVAKIAGGFEMTVVAHDPYQDEGQFAQARATSCSLEELLKLSDFVSLHLPSTPKTKHLLNRSVFEYIQRGICLINTSRGSAISLPDLCEALGKGWIRAVGLDVFEQEPLDRNSPLFGFQNTVLSPHIGATTDEAFGKASWDAAQKAVDFVLSGKTEDLLPPDTDWYRESLA